MRLMAISELAVMEMTSLKKVQGAMLRAVHDADEGVVMVAMGALTKDASRPKSLIPILLKLFRDEKTSEQLRRLAVLGLGRYGPEAAIALPDLFRAYRDQKSPLRIGAGGALAKIAPMEKDVLASLLKVLNDQKEDPGIRGAAAATIGQMGEPGKPAIPDLFEVLKETKRAGEQEKYFSFRKNTLMALRWLKPNKETIPVFMEIVKDKGEHCDIRLDALQAMGNIGPDEKAVPGLVQVLEDQDLKSLQDLRNIFRCKIISQLEMMGPQAKEAIPVLKRIQGSTSYPVFLREASETALKKIQGS
jgi:HEAT repeat protein